MKIGIIGLGDMGKLYAKALAEAGYSVCGCDLPHNRERLVAELANWDITVLENGKQVSETSDFILYSVEAEFIDEVVRENGGFAKKGAIVSGFTSVKFPEVNAFETYLPKYTEIVLLHPLHGPGFLPKDQNLVIIPHRNKPKTYQQLFELFSGLGCRMIEMENFHMHDHIVADTQAVTHVGFESMGTAWKNAGFFPWENNSYSGGIDNVKILITLRIFSYKAHVYEGLAILNPYARHQVRQYAECESVLFKLMIQEKEEEFRQMLYAARDFVFHKSKKPVLLNDATMKEFSLSEKSGTHKPNSHLSLLSMVVAWHKLSVNPYDNMICQTPPFRLRLGIAEYLFKNEALLEESIQTALYDKTIRGDDLEFHSSVREWASIIGYGDKEGYKEHFNQVKEFFKDRLNEGRDLSTELIRRLNID